MQLENILIRLRKHYKVANNRKLSELLEIKYSTLATWLQRDKIPYELLSDCSQNENLSMSWLLFGKGQMSLNEEKNINNGNNFGQNNMIHNGDKIVNTSRFNYKEDVKDLLELLEYAPPAYIKSFKNKLLKFKEMSE